MIKIKVRVMKMFETSFENVIYRFALMMTIVLVAISAGAAYLAILAVPVFLSALLGIKFEFKTAKVKEAKIKSFNHANKAA